MSFLIVWPMRRYYPVIGKHQQQPKPNKQKELYIAQNLATQFSSVYVSRGSKSDLVRWVFRLSHRGTTAQSKATARPAALSAASWLAVVLSLVAQEIGDLEHHPSTVLRSLGWLGLPSCYFSDSVLQPSLRNLRFGPSTLANTTVLCTDIPH